MIFWKLEKYSSWAILLRICLIFQGDKSQIHLVKSKKKIIIYSLSVDGLYKMKQDPKI